MHLWVLDHFLNPCMHLQTFCFFSSYRFLHTLSPGQKTISDSITCHHGGVPRLWHVNSCILRLKNSIFFNVLLHWTIVMYSKCPFRIIRLTWRVLQERFQDLNHFNWRKNHQLDIPPCLYLICYFEIISSIASVRKTSVLYIKNFPHMKLSTHISLAASISLRQSTPV